MTISDVKVSTNDRSLLRKYSSGYEFFFFRHFVLKEARTLRQVREMERESQQGDDGNRCKVPRNRTSLSWSFQCHGRREKAER